MEEIIDYLEKQIQGFSSDIEIQEIGRVVEVKDGTVKILGLKNVESLEIIKFESKNSENPNYEQVFGLILNLEENHAGAVILGKGNEVKDGDIVKRTKKVLSIPVGEDLIGRVVNPLGKPLDQMGEIRGKKIFPLEKIGPSVSERESVSFPLHTGIKIIDALTPIGRGQRELILGDKIGGGKESLAIDAILNQRKELKRPVCIYVAIGKKKSELARIIETFKKFKADEYTIIVSAFAGDSAPFLYLAPYAGCAIGEYFMEQGKDVLIVYDNLTKHAWAWREISLILKRPPGREAYPGDIFYLHSRLLERAAKLSEKKGGGSMTALPIIETQAGDLTSYIPTNIISICDGQIFMDTSLYLKGQRPEVNIGLSVSRVGSAAHLEFAEEVDPETKKTLDRGQRIREILKQEERNPLSFEKQTAIIFAGIKGFLDEIKLEDIAKFEKALFEHLEVQKPELLNKIRDSRDLDKETETELEKTIREIVKEYAVKRNST